MKNIVNNEFHENFDNLFRHLAGNQGNLTVLHIIIAVLMINMLFCSYIFTYLGIIVIFIN